MIEQIPLKRHTSDLDGPCEDHPSDAEPAAPDVTGSLVSGIGLRGIDHVGVIELIEPAGVPEPAGA